MKVFFEICSIIFKMFVIGIILPIIVTLVCMYGVRQVLIIMGIKNLLNLIIIGITLLVLIIADLAFMFYVWYKLEDKI